MQQDRFIWFSVMTDDGFDSLDHLLRIKLLPTDAQLQIESHSRDPNHPERQNKDRSAEILGGAYRLSRMLPKKSVELTLNQRHKGERTSQKSQDGDFSRWPKLDQNETARLL